MGIVTKKMLFLHFIKRSVLVGCIFGAIATIGFYLLDNNILEMPSMRNFLVVSTLLIILSVLYSPLTDLYWLNKQEKVLGIRFNEEMEKNNVITLPHVSNQWFIFKGTNRVFAYHRNYIVNLDNKKDGYAEFIGRIEKITVVSSDGKRREISATSNANVISDFKKWVELGEINFEGFPQQEERI